jgi:two-component system sensor histidine kinase/response regulator
MLAPIKINMKPTYKELEEQIKEFKKRDEEKFNELIKNSFDMIVLLDSNGVQHYVSESCERILGFKQEELINIPIIETMIHPDDQEKTKAGLNEIIKKSANGGTQYRHQHKNGSWVYLEAFGTNQINNPLIKSVVLNVRDITERKKAEKELIESRARLSEANSTKDRFFSIIGHDLMSPFNSIVGFSEILLKRINKKDYNDIENYARIIYDSSQRAINLLTNLLEWSRTQTGRIECNLEYLELVTKINDVVDLLDESAQQKSISILKKLPEDMPILADKAMVETILRNLISNAIKFTNSGGEIIISIEQKSKELIVSVADNGVGIEKENFDNLFRIDYSYSTLGTNKEKGTGLGLLICKEFIEMHGGKIWAESNELRGSIFYFSLPLG